MGALTAARGQTRGPKGTGRQGTGRKGAGRGGNAPVRAVRARAGRQPAARLRVAGLTVRRAAVLALLAAVAVIGACLAAWQATVRPAPAAAPVPAPFAGPVLTAADAGPGYTLNARVSGPRTLGVVSAGDTAAVAAELKAGWLRGAEAAFAGGGARPSIVSIGDVFRAGTPVAAILAAWQADARAALSGSAQPVPANAPGTSPVLLKGSFASYSVLLYMWRSGDTIASVELIGSPAALHAGFLLQLAARQLARG